MMRPAPHGLGLALVLFAGSTAIAQERIVELHKFALYAAGTPVPALRYRLLPELRDLKPGNAALLYHRAHSPEWHGSLPNSPIFKIEWGETLDQFPLKESERIFAFRGLLGELDLAARRSHCDWELTERLRSDGLRMLLPDVQAFRMYANLIHIRTRRALVLEDFETAHRSLQTGLTLGRHVAEGPTLIHFLVGAAIVNLQCQTIEDWIRVPGSPNLFWALTALPRPLMNLERNHQGERLILDSLFPGAREALRNPRAPLPSLEAVREGLKSLASMADPKDVPREPLGDVLFAPRHEDVARKYLLARGLSAAHVEALHAQHAIVLYLVAELDRLYDEQTRWTTVPFWQAEAGLNRDLDRFKKAVEDRQPAALLAAMISPAVLKTTEAHVRLERRIATLRILEAIRLHLAKHGGLPERLEEIDVPLPLDPRSGRPFVYRLENGVGVLLAVDPAVELRYELHVGNAR